MRVSVSCWLVRMLSRPVPRRSTCRHAWQHGKQRAAPRCPARLRHGSGRQGHGVAASAGPSAELVEPHAGVVRLQKKGRAAASGGGPERRQAGGRALASRWRQLGARTHRGTAAAASSWTHIVDEPDVGHAPVACIVALAKPAAGRGELSGWETGSCWAHVRAGGVSPLPLPERSLPSRPQSHPHSRSRRRRPSRKDFGAAGAGHEAQARVARAVWAPKPGRQGALKDGWVVEAHVNQQVEAVKLDSGRREMAGGTMASRQAAAGMRPTRARPAARRRARHQPPRAPLTG